MFWIQPRACMSMLNWSLTMWDSVWITVSQYGLLAPIPTRSPGLTATFAWGWKSVPLLLNQGTRNAPKKSRYDLQRVIKAAKRLYRDKLENDYSGCDSRCMWTVQVIIDYKSKPSMATNTAASPLDELNSPSDSSTVPTRWSQSTGDRCSCE